ncbi:PAS domain-containing protein [Rhodovulum sp. 12E13]|uniref:ATP-binding protein n=1 Tax=Rhodovulum sp. 12E13 TaxID=2203891 RepID=UPI000E1A8D04|nr:PAS domain-containing protein [Rhodovulum sp. 12E13]RDC69909.1 PAS domain-containing protein [Rhodovulum sp. 12E13]
MAGVGTLDDEGEERDVAHAIQRSQLAMVMTDAHAADDPITYVNAAFETMTHYPREAALGRNCRFLQGPQTGPADVARIREGLRSGHEFQVTLTNHRADGTPFRNQILITPVHDESGQLSAHFAVLREVAPPMEVAEEDDDTVELLRELQHRVKNHLAMIVSMIRVQAARDVTPDSLRAIGRRVEALALLYEEMMKAESRPGADRTIAAGSYLGRIAAVVSGLQARDDVEMSLDCDSLELTLDQAARLGLLLSEFLTNALEHAFEGRAGGAVQVRLERLERNVRLTVEDDGIGMPEGSDWPVTAPSISAQHRQAEEGEGRLDTTAQGGQPGVGGSIVAALARSLRADLMVAPRPGGGTSVTVVFEP